jgi:glycosyltransferase involved in cell wall biosynthesis
MDDVKRVLALTAIEVPFRGNLIEGQFLAPILGGGRNEAGLKFRYLSLAPLMFYTGRRQPFKTYWAGRATRGAIKFFTAGLGCRTDIWPIGFPISPRDFNLTRLKYFMYLAFALGPFFSYLFLYRPHLIIARSYPAASVARLARKIFGIPYIFDLRGMYPEECVNAGAFGPGSPDYDWWKLIERTLISESAACVVVSEPFAEHVRSIIPGSGPVVIPCCVDPQRFGYDQSKREQAKARYGLTGRFVLLHLGSFGAPGDRGLVGKYLLRFKKVEPSAVLVVASGTPAYGPAIRAALLGEGLTPEDLMIVHPAGEEVGELLALGDAGLLLERKLPNTKVCLSVKLGEYLASGLPVICTPFVEGAARLVRQHDCGLVIDPEGNDSLEKETTFLRDIGRLREKGLAVARSILALDTCAGNWASTITTALNGTHKEGMHEG